MPVPMQNNGFGLNYGQGFGMKQPSQFGSNGTLEALNQAYGASQGALDRGNALDLMRGNNAGENYRTGLQTNAGIREAKIAAGAQNHAQDLKQQRFGDVFSKLSGGLDFNQNLERVGGTNTAQSAISTNPIWGEGDIQRRVNATRAQNDQQAASQTQQMGQKLAGQGFGSNSPLAALLQSQYQGQALSANTSAENNMRWQAAQGNAAQVLEGQKAKEQQWADWNQMDIGRRQLAGNYTSSLAAALAQMV